MNSRHLPPALGLALPVYLLLLLLLATLGATNQRHYVKQLQLLDAKEQLLTQLADTRRRAAQVNGPTAVATWATRNGMVPSPEVRDAVLVAPAAAPHPELPLPSLEIRTVWR